MNDTNNAYTTAEKLDNRFFAKDRETSELGNEGPAQDSQSAEDPKWREGESQFLLDSQQLAEGIAICDELFQSQSSYAEDEAVKPRKSCLSDYASIGVEYFRRDLQECQKLSREGDRSSYNEVDSTPEMRLSQLEFGSQNSFLG